MIRAILYSEMRHLIEKHADTGHWRLSDKFMNWMKDNNIKAKEQEFIVENSSNLFGLLFETDEDMMAVKLRWL